MEKNKEYAQKTILTITFATMILPILAELFRPAFRANADWQPWFVAALIALPIGYYLSCLGVQRTKEMEEKAREVKKQKQIEEQKQKIKDEEEIKQKYAPIDLKYGTCTKAILNGEIRAYEETGILYIRGEVYKFTDIIGCESPTYPASSSYVTTTNTTDMIQRAAIGGVLLGTAGALAGATTAETHTNTAPRDIEDVLRKAYAPSHVKVYLKSIATPSILVKCRSIDENEICELINAIIAVTRDKSLLESKK